jgi:hypothetical protein
MKLFFKQIVLKPIVVIVLFCLFAAADCETQNEEKKQISIDFTFEVQVHDNVSLPLQGELVYLDTRKYDNGTVKGIFEYQMSTNNDGWVVKYVGYNMDENSDYVVFHASLTGHDNFEDPVVHKIVYYSDLKNLAGEDSHITYTVTGFLEKPESKN